MTHFEEQADEGVVVRMPIPEHLADVHSDFGQEVVDQLPPQAQRLYRQELAREARLGRPPGDPPGGPSIRAFMAMVDRTPPARHPLDGEAS